MDIAPLLRATFSIIDEGDVFKEPKKLHLSNWCRAFLDMFYTNNYSYIIDREPFFLDILADRRCWDQTDTIHGIRLNRRLAAKMIVQPRSPTSRLTPLTDYERYRIACVCCLEEEIATLFDYFKQRGEKNPDGTINMRALLKNLCPDLLSQPLITYWSYIANGCVSDMDTDGMHLYEYGLHLVFVMYGGRVEAVEYFWNKILSDSELSIDQKNEILINTAFSALDDRIDRPPDILDFCIAQMNPELYPELLRRDWDLHLNYLFLEGLEQNIRFDLYLNLFDSLAPDFVGYGAYERALHFPGISNYSPYYANGAKTLFLRVWKKEGCDTLRGMILRDEMTDKGKLFVSLVEKNYFDVLWEILDTIPADIMKTFLKSKQACSIYVLLKEKGDLYLENKFLSYHYVTNDSQNSNAASATEVDSTTLSPTKKIRIE